MDIKRRRVISSGLMVATATPWMGPALVKAEEHGEERAVIYPRIGHRLMTLDGEVFGISAAYTQTSVREPDSKIIQEKVGFSPDLLAGLLVVSQERGGGDPSAVRLKNHEALSDPLTRLMDEEREVMSMLRDAQTRLLWVGGNFWRALYAIGKHFAMLFWPFIEGFMQDWGSWFADWFRDQMEGEWCF